ncbi:hypothetical protein KOW79_016801 [Hemibagrus wyckioides]|uniref:Uncharacterized protein n=1 Tax=Hemibagrus wyckioides TaxID=337641 RepID=A0A9D3NB40_9TELE|nr:hypothetical protein KOW79_016801 [Hemibagrus wyckioides]
MNGPRYWLPSSSEKLSWPTVVERLVMDHFLNALPIEEWMAIGLSGPAIPKEMLEAPLATLKISWSEQREGLTPLQRPPSFNCPKASLHGERSHPLQKAIKCFNQSLKGMLQRVGYLRSSTVSQAIGLKTWLVYIRRN